MNLKKAIQELEEFICLRRYKNSPYEFFVPKEVLKEINDTKIKELIATLNIPKIEKYLKRNNISVNKLGTYLKYRYLLLNYYDYIKELYEDSKRASYFYLKNLSDEEYDLVKKGKYLSYHEYPSNFQVVENTIKRIPFFEHDELFPNSKEEVENLQDLVTGINLNKNNFLYIDTMIVGNEKNFKKLTGLRNYCYSKDGIECYNLYNFIYSKEIKDFLKKYDFYFKNCNLKSIQEFYKKTGLKLKYVIEDKYRLFNFDIYGIHGTDIFGTDYYNEGDYAKYEYDKWDDMQDDYDLRIWINVAHIDYDEEHNVYFQNIYDVWDSYYEDAMDEEEKQELSGEESEKIYLFKKGELDNENRRVF